MDFLGIGWGEILLVLIVALLLWGPDKIVEISRSIGKTVYAFRKAAGDLTTQVSRELEEQKRESSQVGRDNN
jgi:Tat protein translocase TatB subunit